MHYESATIICYRREVIDVQPKALTNTGKRSKHHLSEVREVYGSFHEWGITGNRDCNHFGKTLRSQFDLLQSSQVYVSLILCSLTLNPQFVTAKETGSVLLLLAHLQRLQRVTVYTSQQGKAHTSHNKLHELNTTPASNTQRMQRRTATHSEVTLLPAH